MTTVPGHNIVIQQSVAAQELAQQAKANAHRPSLEQAAAQQKINELAQNTTVQGFDESKKLTSKKEKEALRRKKRTKKEQKKNKKEKQDQDPDATGRLVDTTI